METKLAYFQLSIDKAFIQKNAPGFRVIALGRDIVDLNGTRHVLYTIDGSRLELMKKDEFFNQFTPEP